MNFVLILKIEISLIHDSMIFFLTETIRTFHIILLSVGITFVGVDRNELKCVTLLRSMFLMMNMTKASEGKEQSC